MLVRGCREKEEAVVDSRGVLESKQSSAVAAAREAVSSVCDGVGDNEVNGQTSQRQGRRGGGRARQDKDKEHQKRPRLHSHTNCASMLGFTALRQNNCMRIYMHISTARNVVG
jgi:hypothetical protein